MRDALYRDKETSIKEHENEDKNNFIQEFEMLMEMRRLKLERLGQVKNDLTEEITSLKTEDKVLINLTKNLEEEETDLKSKVKMAMNHHKTCSK